ncbi:MAG: hypothetical protein ABFC38_06430 [Methanospirillum sp.]
MKPGHRHLVTALVPAVILISVLAAPTVARTTLAQAQARANPHWTEQDLRDLLYRHLSTTRDELVARHAKDYTADVAAWDVVYDHILMMFGALSQGVIAQFPETLGA